MLFDYTENTHSNLMKKLLYFICPTDGLEPIINNRFKQENYYYSSLGNSIAFDGNVVEQLKKLISTRNIGAIAFVLSSDNRIVLDALGKQNFSDVTGLNNFYTQITRQKEYSEISWQTWNRQFSVLSYHLNQKIKELKGALNEATTNQLEISGKIYNRREHKFNEIHSDLICMEYLSLN